MNYIIPLIIALFIGSTKDIFKKKVLTKIEPIQFIILFYVMMFIFAQLTIIKIKIPNYYGWFLIILSSFFYVLSNLLGLKLLKEVKITILKPVVGFESIIVVFLSFFILKEVLNLIQLLGVIIILLPIIYMVFKQYKKAALNKSQIIILFSSLLFASLTTIIDRLALKRIDPLSYFYFLKLILIIMFTLVLILFYKNKINLIFLKNNLPQISFLAIFTMIGTYAYFFTLNNPLVNTGIIKTVLSTSIIFSTFFGGKYFHEPNLKEQITISMFVIIGLSILILY